MRDLKKELREDLNLVEEVTNNIIKNPTVATIINSCSNVHICDESDNVNFKDAKSVRKHIEDWTQMTRDRGYNQNDGYVLRVNFGTFYSYIGMKKNGQLFKQSIDADDMFNCESSTYTKLLSSIENAELKDIAEHMFYDENEYNEYIIQLNIKTEVKVTSLIDNKEVAEILDKWNNNYEYSLYYNADMKLIRVDKQQNIEEEVNILSMVKFYIEQLENKLHYQEVEEHRNDLKILLEFVESKC